MIAHLFSDFEERLHSDTNAKQWQSTPCNLFDCVVDFQFLQPRHEIAKSSYTRQDNTLTGKYSFWITSSFNIGANRFQCFLNRAKVACTGIDKNYIFHPAFLGKDEI